MNWVDTAASVIEALATALAVIAAIYAGHYAKRTFETQAAQLAQAEGQASFERDQHARREAAGLAAWWISCDEGKRWGIIISNTAPAPFFDVRVEATGNSVATSIGDGSFAMTVVPPGQFFVESLTATREAEHAAKWRGLPRSPGWEVGAPLAEDLPRVPLLSAYRYRVDRITFRDNAGQAWEWTPADGTVIVTAG